MKRKISILLLFLFFISGCTRTPSEAPLVETKSQKGDVLVKTYGKKPSIPPPPDYFVGISREWDNESDARKEAMNDAFRQILGYIGVNVSIQEVQQIIETLEKGGDVLIPEIFTKKFVEVMGKAFLDLKPESEYIEQWKRTTVYGETYYYKAWVLVKFSKEDYREKLKEIVDSNIKLVNYYISEGEKYEKNLNIALAMRNYISAIEPLLNIQERENELKNLIPDLYNKVKMITSDLKNKIVSISSKIEIRPINPSIKTIVGKKSEEPIKVKVIYKEEGREYPVKDLNLRFEIIKGKGEIDSIKSTGIDGIAICNIYKIYKGENIVEVKPEGWGSEAISVPKARVSIVGVPLVSMVTSAVYFEENVLGKRQESLKLESKLIETLRDRGFNVISQKITGNKEEEFLNNAKKYGIKLLIYGIAEITNVTWVSTALYSTFCKVTIKVYSVDDKRLITTFNIPDEKFKDTRGFGLTEKEAIEDALTLNRAKGFFEYVADKIEELILEEQ